MGSTVSRTFCAGVLLVAVALSSKVSAAEQKVIEEVIVQAQRREEKLMDVPQSVQAFSGEFIEDQNIYNLVDALDYIPGATASFSGGAGSQLYNMRGTGPQGRIGQIGIGFYIDDIPWIAGGPFGPSIELYDLEALEVLRGPQGTLYGQGSMGGTFIITTAKPDLERVAGSGRVYGHNEKSGDPTYGFDATGSVPIVKDQLALRITGGYEDGGGLAESNDYPGKNIDPYTQWDTRGKLLWKPSDSLSVTATYWISKEKRDFSPGIYASVDPPMINGTGGIKGSADQKTQLASVLVDWDTGIGRLTSASSYIRGDGLFDSTFAFDTFIPGVGLINGALQLTVPGDAETFDQEFRFSSIGEGPWQWIVGAQYSDVKSSADVISAYVAGPDFLTGIPPVIGYGEGTSKRWSVFGEISRDFFDGKLTPLVGLRYFEDRQTSRGASSVSPQVDYIKAKFDSLSPRFNLSYKPTDTSTIYLNVAKGFRSGLFNSPTSIDNARFVGIDIPRAVDESEVWSYEIGGRFQLLGGRMQVEPAAYYADYDNYQFEGSNGNVNFDLPIDTVVSKGIDLLITYFLPVDGLVLRLSGNVNSTEPTKIDPAFVLAQASLAKNEQLPFVPKWEYNIGVNYEHALWSNYQWFFTGTWYERDSQVDFITGLESAVIHDLSLQIGMRADHWSLALIGENLTDEKGPAVIAGGLPNRYDRRRIGLKLTGTL